MTEPLPFTPTSEVLRRQLAEGAYDLLNNSSFNAAILALRKRYFEDLMLPQISTELKLSIIERIRSLEDMPQQLQLFINDLTMAQARRK